MNFISSHVNLKCKNCGKEFSTEYYNFGSIHHGNWINNIQHYMSKGIEYLIKSYDLRKDNFCNVIDDSSSDHEHIVNCASVYLKNNNADMFYQFSEYFKNRNNVIDEIFSKYDESVKEDLSFYWARLNYVIDLYVKYPDMEIVKNDTIDSEFHNEKKFIYSVKTGSKTIILDFKR